ncbi:unnamed protein product [Urochloa humidicola]
MDQEASMLGRLEGMLFDESIEPTYLPISLLKAITKNFSDDQEIGRGGFSVVYKGLLRNGIVAVKKLLDSVDMNEEKFNQEIDCLMRVKHKNIVRFLGYCADTQGELFSYKGRHVLAERRQMLLCFEYVSGGTLDNYLTDVSTGLEWRKRYSIIMGICQGLHYLHQQHIVHLDLKPGNILLDYNMVPKISDFGYSRSFQENQTRELTKTIAGSIGYLAPEFYNGVITFKLDIYALGVIIAEILTGKKGYSSVERVLECWMNRSMMSGEELDQIKVCAEISIDCLDSNPDNRPEIQRIIEALNETESMDKLINAGKMTLSQEEKPSKRVEQGTATMSGVERAEVNSAFNHG